MTQSYTTDPTDGDAEPILSTDDLTKKFGTLTAVDGVSLEIPADRITSIIGPNGAGKTTLFNLFTGKYEPTEGRIALRGDRIDGKEPHHLVERGLVRSFQINNFFADLTARENVRLATQAPYTGFRPRDFLAHHRDLDVATESANRILERVHLSNVADETASNLSYGQRRHLEIGISLAADPDLFLMDEPTAGMSPEETRETVELVEEIASDITLILIEHDMHIVMDISDQIVVMNEGMVLARGTPDQIRNDERVQRAYLGSE
ncbi:putative branched-chain amino acid transport ATP-binding protein LivG [Halalkalicoccus paucihalophilus]|uniref:Probable branched-chain amino acid transport ATP-binding protein LivG n=1 Tax=Halalkalicoccus paucihalophilus TaxID=1008153 RepID=A0A151A818_9EURY|nr:ABC transporter ATP-binding protein [Halalkalicoccus paucihalophilus]KYH23848.1 putative branched-chain amino acid transport ATP-binding protein LivG [Halalkalicoccus paucihalophilus]